MQGSLEDMQGRFNLNNLAHVSRSGPDGSTTTGNTGRRAAPATPASRPLALAISAAAGVSRAGAQMGRNRARLDRRATNSPGSPDGAEDAVYTAQSPALPYRQLAHDEPHRTHESAGLRRRPLPKNRALRHRAARRHGYTINICTAPGVVIESLADGLNGEYSGNPGSAGQRPQGRLLSGHRRHSPTSSGQIAPRRRSRITARPRTYFRLTTRVRLGTTEFTLYSLL